VADYEAGCHRGGAQNDVRSTIFDVGSPVGQAANQPVAASARLRHQIAAAPLVSGRARCDNRGGLSPLNVVAAAIIDRGRVLLASKQQAPDVFYLPGGKPETDEEPVETLARELAEELGVAIVDAEPFGVVSDQAALEGREMEMLVYLVRVDGPIAPTAEIAALAWVRGDGECPGTLAPAIRNHVLPQLVARRLIA
jgi:8-oxo-dGTP diphosphatase